MSDEADTRAYPNDKDGEEPASDHEPTHPEAAAVDPGWKRRLRQLAVWVSGLITAAVTAVVATSAQDLFGITKSNPSAAPASSEKMTPGPIVKVDAVNLKRSNTQGEVYIFAKAVNPSAAELADLNSRPLGDAYDQWFRSRGAVDPDVVDISLVVEGNSNQQVRITDMQVAKKCSAPLTGTMFYSPPAGSELTTKLFFDLDQPDSVAKDMRDNQPEGDFFSDHTVALAPYEQAVFEIRAATSKHYCSFSLELTIVSRDGTTKETVTNNGQLFQVTASPLYSSIMSTDPTPLKTYQDLYVGGVASRCQDCGRNGFYRENPATYKIF